VNLSTWVVSEPSTSLTFDSSCRTHAIELINSENAVIMYADSSGFGNVITLAINNSTWAVTTLVAKQHLAYSFSFPAITENSDATYSMLSFRGNNDDGFIQVTQNSKTKFVNKPSTWNLEYDTASGQEQTPALVNIDDGWFVHVYDRVSLSSAQVFAIELT